MPSSDIRFLRDLNYRDPTGERHLEQQIFDEIFSLIAGAERLVLVDMFLFNEFVGEGPPPARKLCEELTAALISRKQAVPGLQVVVITDPVNTIYGGIEAGHLQRLEAAGVKVVMTDLNRLRDSNPLWSCFWRLLFKPWGNSSEGGWVASPFDDGKVTLRSWLTLLNFKANHRKALVADAGDQVYAVVTSANPHDGSSAHSNVGVVFNGPAAIEVLKTEEAVMAFCGWQGTPPSQALEEGAGTAPQAPDATPDATPADEPAGISVSVLTEKAVARAAETMIAATAAGDALDVVMFYLADRKIVRALKAAADRGVDLRIILDPNKDAFGRNKNGQPNRQVARELIRSSVPIRWGDTDGEQMHAKMMMTRGADGHAELLLGSTNFTRRNLRNFNLETNVLVTGGEAAPVLAEAAGFVDMLWNNPEGRFFTTDYETYRDDSRWRVFLYRFMEATGLSTW